MAEVPLELFARFHAAGDALVAGDSVATRDDEAPCFFFHIHACKYRVLANLVTFSEKNAHVGPAAEKSRHTETACNYAGEVSAHNEGVPVEGFDLISTGAWSIVPPLLALGLALITKEVYSSLTIGVLMGMVIYQFTLAGVGVDQFIAAFTMVPRMMATQIADNGALLLFLALLGALTVVIAIAGGSRAYAEWVSKHVKNARLASVLTAVLGILIFVDDYFNCLTVGAVMRPVTDRFHVSHEKLAWIIDATAAPVCIIAPVSSWAAAVTSSLPEGSEIDGFALFLSTIPLNLYAWLTVIFMLVLIWSGKDFSRMAAFEKKSGGTLVIPEEYADDESSAPVGNGRIIDLVLPLFVLICGCIFGMLYTGGILEGKGVADAFANCESARGLVIGSFIALVFTFVLYIPRKVLSFGTFCSCFGEGFKQMTSAIMILTLAWTLSGVVGKEYLNIGGYVGNVVSDNASVAIMLPALFFLVAIGLAFATGTSWGTFGILIPIVLAVVNNDQNLMVMTVAAVLAGSVGGDHISPISDTTILASAGAQCHHIDHVSTQIPYVMVVASSCVVGYLVDGFTGNGLAGGVVALVMMLAIQFFFLKFRSNG